MTKLDSKRAADIMGKRQRDERKAVRVPIHVAATADCPQLGHLGASALIRDISPQGVFFFAAFVPELGVEISLSFNSLQYAVDTRVFCSGKVVRIEQFASGASGIALKLDRYQVQEGGP